MPFYVAKSASLTKAAMPAQTQHCLPTLLLPKPPLPAALPAQEAWLVLHVPLPLARLSEAWAIQRTETGHQMQEREGTAEHSA